MLFRILWNAGERAEAFKEMKRLQHFGHSEEYARMMREWNEGKKDEGTTAEIQ